MSTLSYKIGRSQQGVIKEVYVSNMPYIANECDLQIFLEKLTGLGTVCHCELMQDGFQPRHKGYGFVTFSEEEVAEQLRLVSNLNWLIFQGRSLRINASKRQVKHNPEHNVFKLEGIVGLAMGCLTGDTFHTLWNIGTNDSEFDFRQRKFSLKVVDYDSEDWKNPVYKLEFRFKYIYRTYFAETSGSSAIGRMCGPMWLFEVGHSYLLTTEYFPALKLFSHDANSIRTRKERTKRESSTFYIFVEINN